MHNLLNNNSDCFLFALLLLSRQLLLIPPLIQPLQKKLFDSTLYFCLFFSELKQSRLSGDKDKTESCFILCLSGLFSHNLTREKADGLSLWLHMNLYKYVAVAVMERSVIFQPL